MELHLSSATNVALGFDLELLGSGARFPAPALAAAVGNNVLVTWPATNTTGYTLYSTTDLNAGGGWSVFRRRSKPTPAKSAPRSRRRPTGCSSVFKVFHACLAKTFGIKH